MRALVATTDLREAVEELLRARGHEVVRCGAGPSALAMACRDGVPALVVVGAARPVALVAAVRGLEGGGRCALLFLARDREEARQALDAGADDFLILPCSLAGVADRVMLAERRARERQAWSTAVYRSQIVAFDTLPTSRPPQFASDSLGASTTQHSGPSLVLPLGDGSTTRPRDLVSVKPPHGIRPSVLVVDDELVLGRSISRVLRGDYDVTVVNSGSEALEACGKQDFDVILCDLMMPGMTGMEVYRRLDRVRDHFLFATGGTFTSEAAAFLEGVPNRCLAKPFDLDELRAEVACCAAQDRSMAVRATG